MKAAEFAEEAAADEDDQGDEEASAVRRRLAVEEEGDLRRRGKTIGKSVREGECEAGDLSKQKIIKNSISNLIILPVGSREWYGGG